MDKCVQKTTVNCHNCHAFGVCSEIADACEAYLHGELTKEGECNAKVYKNSRANLLGYFIGLNVLTSTFVGGFDDPRSSKRPNRSSL